MPRAASAVVSAAALMTVMACSGLSDSEAESLVRAYNDRLIEAYRSGDYEIMEEVAGNEEAKKLFGLIGVKMDIGVTLDAQLLDIRFEGVERLGSSVEILTDERWYYQDRRIGAGDVVGPQSIDHYVMRYVLREEAGRWVVSEVRFEEPPEVGRADELEENLARQGHSLPDPDRDGDAARDSTGGDR